MEKIGLGGSCHWCTEAIFQSLKGVHQVDQGWIGAREAASFSEAVVVHYDPLEISLSVLIKVHLYTHSCTNAHTLREKYRSAVYVFNKKQEVDANKILEQLQIYFESSIITQVLQFNLFELNQEMYLNYYRNNPQKPFCQTRIEPKLQQVLQEFAKHVKAK